METAEKGLEEKTSIPKDFKSDVYQYSGTWRCFHRRLPAGHPFGCVPQAGYGILPRNWKRSIANKS